MSSAPESKLVRRAASGDRQAFAEIVHLHQQAVFNVAYRMLGNARDAEDAAQEAFLRAYQFFDKFDPEKPLAPWLKRITLNLCLNRLKADRPASSLEDDLHSPRDPHPGPEALAVTREREACIRAALARLPARYRAVIELRHFQELSYEEIARTLERPLSDVKSDLFRARRLLAERLIEIV